MVVMCIVSWNRPFGSVENVEMFTDEQIDECWIKWDKKKPHLFFHIRRAQTVISFKDLHIFGKSLAYKSKLLCP